MTNLDILATILAEVTNRPASYWREMVRTIIAAAGRDIADTQLLESVPPPEAARLLAELRAEKPGILRWALGGTLPPSQRRRLHLFRHNLQN